MNILYIRFEDYPYGTASSFRAFTLSKLIGEPVIDVWDILSVFILLIVSVAFIIGDYARKKGFVR